MSFRPALVDRQGGPITGKEGGPMSLAKPAINWSHVAGKRHLWTKGPGHRSEVACPHRGHCLEVEVMVLKPACSCRCTSSFRRTESSRSFNAEFYVASVTVIPIFFITLAVEVRAASYPIMRRMVALYRYRKLRRFESMLERFHWLIRGMLVALTALLVPVVAFGWAAEVIGLLALDKRTIGPSQHVLVVIGVVALPTVVFLWAIAIREREPTPLDEELDRLSRSRRETINGMSERLRSMEWAARRDDTSDTAKVRRTRRQLGALTRRDQKLTSSTGKARRSLQTLREHQQR